MRAHRSLTSYSARLCLACLAVLLLLPSSYVMGQNIYGRIVGTVTDQSGAVVPGVTVTVVNSATGESRVYVTDDVGNYVANNLLPSEYWVEAELAGFKKVIRKGITVVVDRTVRVDLVLELGQPTELIEVRADASMLTTEQSSLGHVVAKRELEELPMAGAGGRNYLSLMLLAPGITSQPGEGYALNNMRINGGRPRADDYLLDGTSIQQIVFGGPAIQPPVEAIQEFKVEINNYPAEYGRISGGIVTAVTRSGSNEFHGVAYEFLRNDALDARNFFLPETSKKNFVRQNEFGFAIGGPIIKDKLFFFGDYQAFRRSNGVFFKDVQVPSLSFKQGDFSSLLGAPIGTDPCGRPVLRGAIYDPSTQRVASAGDPTCPSGSGGKAIRDPFKNNIIPKNRFSSAAGKFMALWPDPNTGVTNYSTLAANRNDVNRFDARVDFNPSRNDQFFFVYHLQDSDSLNANPFFGTGDDGIADTPTALTAAWNHSFASNMINEFRFGLTRRSPGRRPAGFGKLGAVDFGVNAFNECTVIKQSNGKCGIPQVGVLGFRGLGSGGTLFEPARILQFSDSVSKVIGRHNLKLGTDIRHFQIQNYQPNRINGTYSFRAPQTESPGFRGKTGAAFASFLLGLADTAGGQVQFDWLQTSTMTYSFYIQDDWKVRPGFTLNLGLRYQYDQPWVEKNNMAATVDRFTMEWQLYGVNAPRTAFDRDLNNFGPRLGFTWNPFASFVVRGGYAMMYPGNTTQGRGGDHNEGPFLKIPTSWRNVQLDNLPPYNKSIANRDAVLASAKAWFVSSNRKQRQAYIQQWNLTVENEMSKNALVSVSYAGSKGTKLHGNFWYNIYQRSKEEVIKNGWDGLYSSDGPLGPKGNGSSVWYLYPNFDSYSSSIYHSAQIKVEKRFSDGLSFLGSYTMSKLIDDASSDWGGFGGLDALGQDYLNRQADRALSAGDVPQRFVFSYIYEVPRPIKEGPGAQILGGWKMSGITTLQSGLPFGVYDSCWGYCNAARAIQTRPFKVGSVHLPSSERTLNRFINVGAYDFSNAKNFDAKRPFGDAPRFDSQARGPGFVNFDFALIKSVGVPWLGESGAFDFRAEFFNLFNTPQFAMPVTDFWSSNFARVLSTARDNRQIQFGLKLKF